MTAVARCISLRKQTARTCRLARHRPGGGPDSEHTAEYPGAFGPLVLLLLHDFPDPGRSHLNLCSSPLGHFFELFQFTAEANRRGHDRGCQRCRPPAGQGSHRGDGGRAVPGGAKVAAVLIVIAAQHVHVRISFGWRARPLASHLPPALATGRQPEGQCQGRLRAYVKQACARGPAVTATHDAAPEAYHSPAAVWRGVIAPSLRIAPVKRAKILRSGTVTTVNRFGSTEIVALIAVAPVSCEKSETQVCPHRWHFLAHRRRASYPIVGYTPSRHRAPVRHPDTVQRPPHRLHISA